MLDSSCQAKRKSEIQIVFRIHSDDGNIIANDGLICNRVVSRLLCQTTVLTGLHSACCPRAEHRQIDFNRDRIRFTTMFDTLCNLKFEMCVIFWVHPEMLMPCCLCVFFVVHISWLVRVYVVSCFARNPQVPHQVSVFQSPSDGQILVVLSRNTDDKTLRLFSCSKFL